MTRDVVVTYLEMLSPAALPPRPAAPEALTLRHETGPNAAALAGMLYRSVGGPWYWRDRLGWGDAEWQSEIAVDGSELWTALRGETIVGYFQLIRQESAVDVKYFGLMADQVGKGIGRWLLDAAVRRAWSASPEKVTVNTCSLDSPVALPNYLARGFTIVRQVHELRELPE